MSGEEPSNFSLGRHGKYALLVPYEVRGIFFWKRRMIRLLRCSGGCGLQGGGKRQLEV